MWKRQQPHSKRHYAGDVCRMPYDLALCGRIFGLQKKRIQNYHDEWTSRTGARYILDEPWSLGSTDFVHYVALLHVMQHPKDWGVLQDVYSKDRYQMDVPAKALYELLALQAHGSARADLKESILLMIKTTLDVIKGGDEVIYIGLGLHSGSVAFRSGIGRAGAHITLTPNKSLIDSPGITENVSRIIGYKSGLARLIDYQVTARLDAGLCLDRYGWRDLLCHETRIDHFTAPFDAALEELRATGTFAVSYPDAERTLVKLKY